MGNISASLPSQQRLRVFDAYRGRGRRTNPLWLVYSVKMDQDFILDSDRRFVHWLAFLEPNRLVKTFEPSRPESGSSSGTAIKVQLTDGSFETHIVTAGRPTAHDVQVFNSQQLHRDAVKIFTDVELKPQVSFAMRWHKALTFAAALRDKECLAIRTALVPLLRSVNSGTLDRILMELDQFDEQILLGMMVRLAVEGHVDIDLSRSGFHYSTLWSWCEGEKHVVA